VDQNNEVNPVDGTFEVFPLISKEKPQIWRVACKKGLGFFPHIETHRSFKISLVLNRKKIYEKTFFSRSIEGIKARKVPFCLNLNAYKRVKIEFHDDGKVPLENCKLVFKTFSRNNSYLEGQFVTNEKGLVDYLIQSNRIVTEPNNRTILYVSSLDSRFFGQIYFSEKWFTGNGGEVLRMKMGERVLHSSFTLFGSKNEKILRFSSHLVGGLEKNFPWHLKKKEKILQLLGPPMKVPPKIYFQSPDHMPLIFSKHLIAPGKYNVYLTSSGTLVYQLIVDSNVPKEGVMGFLKSSVPSFSKQPNKTLWRRVGDVWKVRWEWNEVPFSPHIDLKIVSHSLPYLISSQSIRLSPRHSRILIKRDLRSRLQALKVQFLFPQASKQKKEGFIFLSNNQLKPQSIVGSPKKHGEIVCLPTGQSSVFSIHPKLGLLKGRIDTGKQLLLFTSKPFARIPYVVKKKPSNVIHNLQIQLLPKSKQWFLKRKIVLWKLEQNRIQSSEKFLKQLLSFPTFQLKETGFLKPLFPGEHTVYIFSKTKSFATKNTYKVQPSSFFVEQTPKEEKRLKFIISEIRDH
jgi:hypothetical protein